LPGRVPYSAEATTGRIGGPAPVTKTCGRDLLSEAGLPMRQILTLVTYGLFSQLCSFASHMFIADGLGPGRYGMFMFGLSLQYWLALVGSLGARAVLVREAGRDLDRWSRVFPAHLVLNGGPALVFAIVGWGIIWVAPIGPDERKLLGCILLANVAGCLIPLALFDAQGLQTASMRVIASVELGSLAVVAWLRITDQLTVALAGTVWLAKTWCSLVAHGAIGWHRAAVGRMSFCRQTMIRIVRSSLPLLLASVVSGLPLTSGPLLLRWSGDAVGVAFLGIATQAANAFQLFASYPLRTIHPTVLAPVADRPTAAAQLSRAYLFYLGVVWLGGSSVGGLLTHRILQSNYRPALGPVILLLTAALFQAVGNLATVHLVARRREVRVLSCQAGAALLYVIGTLGLTPYIAYHGAAWTAVGSCLLSSGLMTLQIARSAKDPS